MLKQKGEFKNVREILCFLKNQPEVISAKQLNQKDKFGNIVIKTRLARTIHPARKFFMAHCLQENFGDLRISVV